MKKEWGLEDEWWVLRGVVWGEERIVGKMYIQ
jgi:hypothetical protein